MNNMDCKTCRSRFPDSLFEPDLPMDPAFSAHLDTCAPCKAELDEMRATFLLMDEWTAPEPSPYFDSRVRAHLREVQAAEPDSLWERLLATVRFSTGRGLRSTLAGVFLLILVLGGGTVATLMGTHNPTPAASPAVNDLKIYDNNAQALQQMDLLDEPNSDAGTAAPQS